jgi:LysM repeat protein
MMSRWGMHAPNAGFRRMNEFYGAGFQNYTVLHVNEDLIPQIRQRYPNARIVVRMYLQNWFASDPANWSREIADIANRLRPQTNELTWANEQNLNLEGHPHGASPSQPVPPASLYQDINRWNLETIQRLRGLIPWARLHYPAFANDHSDDKNQGGYVGLEICRTSIQSADAMDCHCYWPVEAGPLTLDGGQRFVLTHNLFPEKPIFISECGNFAVADPRSPEQYLTFTRSLYNYPYVEGATFFIWDSDAAPENAQNIIQRSDGLVKALVEVSKDPPVTLPQVPAAASPPLPPQLAPAPMSAPVPPVALPGGSIPGTVGGAIYIVRSGDTLSAIATRLNVTVPALVAANNLTNPNLIRAGQRLVIPNAASVLSVAADMAQAAPAATTAGVLGIGDPTTPVVSPEEIRAYLHGKRTTYYMTRKGDTIPRIAALFNTNALILAQINQVPTTAELSPSTRLIIPL